MRLLKIFALGLFLVSCDPFHKERVLTFETDLREIIEFSKSETAVSPSSDFDHSFSKKMKEMNIDQFYNSSLDKTNQPFEGFFEESDSLIILIKKSRNILEPEKRIIYDFASKPRNYGNERIEGAAYELTQLNERWYFSTVGFD